MREALSHRDKDGKREAETWQLEEVSLSVKPSYTRATEKYGESEKLIKTSPTVHTHLKKN